MPSLAGRRLAALAALALLACSPDAITSSRELPPDPLFAKGGTPPTPQLTIVISPAAATMLVGASVQLTATVHDRKGRLVTGREINWSSSDPTRASVSGTGLVTAIAGGGPLAITASLVKDPTVQGSAAITVVTQVAQGSIDMTAGWDGWRQIGMFGAAPGSTIVGQSFTVPSTTPNLTGFTFWLNAHVTYPANIIFKVQVMAWDGSKGSGNVLWTSGVLFGPTTYMQRYDVAIPSLPLTPGAQYIAFLSTQETQALFPSGAQVLIGYGWNPYSGGRFYSISNSTDPARLTSTPWEVDLGGDFDAAVILSFAAPSVTVP